MFGELPRTTYAGCLAQPEFRTREQMKVKNFVIYCFAILNYAKLSKLSIVLHNNSLILQYPNLTAGHSVNGQCTVKDDHHTINAANKSYIHKNCTSCFSPISIKKLLLSPSELEKSFTKRYISVLPKIRT